MTQSENRLGVMRSTHIKEMLQSAATSRDALSLTDLFHTSHERREFDDTFTHNGGTFRVTVDLWKEYIKGYTRPVPHRTVCIRDMQHKVLYQRTGQCWTVEGHGGEISNEPFDDAAALVQEAKEAFESQYTVEYEPAGFDDLDNSDYNAKAGQAVINSYREQKERMTDAQISELLSRLQDERNRRKSRGRKGERPEWPTAGTDAEQFSGDNGE